MPAFLLTIEADHAEDTEGFRGVRHAACGQRIDLHYALSAVACESTVGVETIPGWDDDYECKGCGGWLICSPLSVEQTWLLHHLSSSTTAITLQVGAVMSPPRLRRYVAGLPSPLRGAGIDDDD